MKPKVFEGKPKVAERSDWLFAKVYCGSLDFYIKAFLTRSEGASRHESGAKDRPKAENSQQQMT
jgi:hypothetical protein